MPQKFELLAVLTPYAGVLRYELPTPRDEIDLQAFISLVREFFEWIGDAGQLPELGSPHKEATFRK